MRGRAFLLLRNYLEIIIVAVKVEGRISESWESTLGLLQGSVLSMLLSALYLSSSQHFLEQAAHGARWITAGGHIARTNIRFYVDDGLLPAETKEALQRMLDIVARWTRLWRIRFRLGPEKMAFMCTGGFDPARQGSVYITRASSC